MKTIEMARLQIGAWSADNIGVACRNLCFGGLTTEAPKREGLWRRRLEVLGSVVSSPFGSGRSPGRKRVLEYLKLEKNTPDSQKSLIFDISAAYMYI